MQFDGLLMNTACYRRPTLTASLFLSTFENKTPSYEYGAVVHDELLSVQCLYIFPTLWTFVISAVKPVCLLSCTKSSDKHEEPLLATKFLLCLLALQCPLRRKSMYDICKVSLMLIGRCSFAPDTWTIAWLLFQTALFMINDCNIFFITTSTSIRLNLSMFLVPMPLRNFWDLTCS